MGSEMCIRDRFLLRASRHSCTSVRPYAWPWSVRYDKCDYICSGRRCDAIRFAFQDGLSDTMRCDLIFQIRCPIQYDAISKSSGADAIRCDVMWLAWLAAMAGFAKWLASLNGFAKWLASLNGCYGWLLWLLLGKWGWAEARRR